MRVNQDHSKNGDVNPTNPMSSTCQDHTATRYIHPIGRVRHSCTNTTSRQPVASRVDLKRDVRFQLTPPPSAIGEQAAIRKAIKSICSKLMDRSGYLREKDNFGFNGSLYKTKHTQNTRSKLPRASVIADENSLDVSPLAL